MPQATADAVTRTCFLGIAVPAEVGRVIARAVHPLLGDDVRAVAHDRYHLTLVYYGDVAEETIGELGSAIAARSHGEVPLRLRPGAPGRFGRGTVLWVGLDGDIARLADLRRDLFAATGRFGTASTGAGGVDEHRAESFVPHVTVARSRRPGRSARRFTAATPRWGAAAFLADRLYLYETSRGSYRVLHGFPLAGAGRAEEGRSAPQPERAAPRLRATRRPRPGPGARDPG